METGFQAKQSIFNKVDIALLAIAIALVMIGPSALKITEMN